LADNGDVVPAAFVEARHNALHGDIILAVAVFVDFSCDHAVRHRLVIAGHPDTEEIAVGRCGAVADQVKQPDRFGRIYPEGDRKIGGAGLPDVLAETYLGIVRAVYMDGLRARVAGGDAGDVGQCRIDLSDLVTGDRAIVLFKCPAVNRKGGHSILLVMPIPAHR
jgi:hypothetical protein